MIIYLGRFDEEGNCLSLVKSVSAKHILKILEKRGYEQISKESFEARLHERRLRMLGHE